MAGRRSSPQQSSTIPFGSFVRDLSCDLILLLKQPPCFHGVLPPFEVVVAFFTVSFCWRNLSGASLFLAESSHPCLTSASDRLGSGDPQVRFVWSVHPSFHRSPLSRAGSRGEVRILSLDRSDAPYLVPYSYASPRMLSVIRSSGEQRKQPSSQAPPCLRFSPPVLREIFF